jgi:hypothetical protein
MARCSLGLPASECQGMPSWPTRPRTAIVSGARAWSSGRCRGCLSSASPEPDVSGRRTRSGRAVETPGRGSARRHDTTRHGGAGRGGAMTASPVRARATGVAVVGAGRWLGRPTHRGGAAPHSRSPSGISIHGCDAPRRWRSTWSAGSVNRNTTSRCAGLSCGRRRRLPPCRLTAARGTARLLVLLLVVIRTLPVLEPTPNRRDQGTGVLPPVPRPVRHRALLRSRRGRPLR